MTSNPTERQIESLTVKTLPKIILHAGKAFIAALVFVLYGCNSDTDSDKRIYRSPFDALEDYASCLHQLNSIDMADTKQLIELVKEWKALDDTIASRFFREPYGVENNRTDSVYICIRDSIVMRLGDLAGAQKRTLSDYCLLVASLNTQPADSATLALEKSMHHFLGSMDSTTTFKLTPKATIEKYESMLDNTIASGFTSKQQVFDYLGAEDKAFRSFLEHLPKLGNIPLAKVRDNSAEVMKQIITLASDRCGTFQPTELVTILTMRNNRRLIQNALQCVNDIRTGKVGKDNRASAYMWMIIQPWISFDSLSYSLMSEAQFKTMGILAAETPKCIEKLGNPDFPIDIEELPILLMCTFISTL